MVLVDLVDGEAGCCDGITRQHAHRNQDMQQSLDTVGKKQDRSDVSRNNDVINNLP